MTKDNELEIVNSAFEMPSDDSFTDAELAALKRACTDDALISAIGRISIVSNRELCEAENSTKIAMAAGVSCAYSGFRGILKMIRRQMFGDGSQMPSIADGAESESSCEIEPISRANPIIEISSLTFRRMRYDSSWEKDRIYRVYFDENGSVRYFVNGTDCTDSIDEMMKDAQGI